MRESWSNNFIFILVCAGSAIGLGNLWKFPYITWKNGGGWFVLIYLLCIVLVGLPIMFSEILIGKITRKNPYEAFKALDHRRSIFRFVGLLGVITSFVILSYYSVITGWTLEYQLKSIKKEFRHVPLQNMFEILNSEGISLQNTENYSAKDVSFEKITNLIESSNTPIARKIKKKNFSESVSSFLSYDIQLGLLQDTGLIAKTSKIQQSLSAIWENYYQGLKPPVIATNAQLVNDIFKKEYKNIEQKLQKQDPLLLEKWYKKLFIIRSKSDNYEEWLEKAFLPHYTSHQFSLFLAKPNKILLWHLIIIIVIALILTQGIRRGIENFAKYAMVLLFIVMVALMGNSLMSDIANQGIKLLLIGEPSKLTWSSCLEALGHAFFTLSLGMGAMMTYGSYLEPKANVLSNSITIVAIDTLIAIMSCLILFPLLFVHGIEPKNSGIGMLFTALPVEFVNLPGGYYFSVLFYSLLLLAAITSAISLLEVVVTYLTEKLEVTRGIAVFISAVIVFVCGLPSVLSTSFLSLADQFVSHILLPAGGLCTILFVGYKLSPTILSKELSQYSHPFILKGALLSIRYIAPLAMGIVFIHLLIVLVYN